jgi:hypothetical protein
MARQILNFFNHPDYAKMCKFYRSELKLSDRYSRSYSNYVKYNWQEFFGEHPADFIFIASKHKNPLQRVRASTTAEPTQQAITTEYDNEKYLQLVLDAEAILAPFGFDRRVSDNGSARTTDWKEVLRKEYEQCIAMETGLTLYDVEQINICMEVQSLDHVACGMTFTPTLTR